MKRFFNFKIGRYFIFLHLINNSILCDFYVIPKKKEYGTKNVKELLH